MNHPEPLVLFEVRGPGGFVTLNRPSALNALSLAMIRLLTAQLLDWQAQPQIHFVALRGMGRDGPFGAFCAGGDIRFFHQAARAGDPALEDFFTEEYRLNHLIHTFGKPVVACMDGITMGGGMGLSQGAALRIVTERSQLAMPETGIGLFPDVGGGVFLSRCPGRIGEYLALTGQTLGPDDALYAGLADIVVPSALLPMIWRTLGDEFISGGQALPWLRSLAPDSIAVNAELVRTKSDIDHYFSGTDVLDIVQALEAAETGDAAWAQRTAAVLRQRSPLMLHVVLRQIRQARSLSLADDLRLERGLVRHCFHLRPAGGSETVEGIRALAIDKDRQPRWHPATIEQVDLAEVEAFFVPPWPAHAHPLRQLG